MTQSTATAEVTPAYTSGLWWKEIGGKGSGQYESMDVLILATTGDAGWLQTRTHQHWYDTPNGKRSFTYECPRQNHAPAYAANIPCVACDEQNKRFGTEGAVRSRYWVWVIDLKDDNKLKYLDMPYSVRNLVIGAVNDPDSLAYAEGGNIFNVPLRISRKGVKISTEYSVTPTKAEKLDINEVLISQGHVNPEDPTKGKAPQMMAPYQAGVYPPIRQITAEQVANLANGILPWAQASTTGQDTQSTAASTLDKAHATASTVEPETVSKSTAEEPLNMNQSTSDFDAHVAGHEEPVKADTEEVQENTYF